MSNIAILSGWGIPTIVFDDIKKQLPEATILSLPGIFEWPNISPLQKISMDDLINSLDELLSDKVSVLMGWSLGGLIAIYYAYKRPNKIKKLVLMGCNPSFVMQNDWIYAMEKEIFAKFEYGVINDTKRTLKTFLYNCVQGAINEKEYMLKLVKATKKMELNLPQLKSMLTLLRHDSRELLSKITCSVTHIFAKQDKLVPVQIASKIIKLYKNHHVFILDGCHVLFWDNLEKILSILAKDKVLE